MAYHTVAYLIVFLPVTACVYQLARSDKRRYILLLAGYYFFWTFSKMLLFFLIGTTLFTHYICLWMTSIRKQKLYSNTGKTEGTHRKTGKNKEEKKILLFGILVLLGVLGYLKYHNFFVSNWNFIADRLGLVSSLKAKEILTPIGISFYTLQAIGYMIDVYWNKTEVYPHPGKIALFLGFFPQIMEGPISSYAQTADQLWKGEAIRLENLCKGSVRILWGLFKKLIIADRLYVLVDTIYGKPEDYKGAAIAVAAVAYTIQLYNEFSGCMDIVIGSGRVFGIQLPENFRQPFFAESAADFWRRWHITLGVWFRTYVFYPVSVSGTMKKWTKYARAHFGKNMAKMGTMAMALFPVWLCNGLWHGPKWSYIFYGMYYFVILLLEAAFEPVRDSLFRKGMIRKEAVWFRALRIVKTWIIIFTGELFFRADELNIGIKMFLNMFREFSIRQLNRDFWLGLGLDKADYIAVAAGCAVVLTVDILKEKKLLGEDGLNKLCLPVRWGIYYSLLFSVIIFGAYGIGYKTVDLIYAGF